MSGKIRVRTFQHALIAVSVLYALSVASGFAQTTNATLVGTVLDSQSARASNHYRARLLPAR